MPPFLCACNCTLDSCIENSYQPDFAPSCGIKGKWKCETNQNSGLSCEYTPDKAVDGDLKKCSRWWRLDMHDFQLVRENSREEMVEI